MKRDVVSILLIILIIAIIAYSVITYIQFRRLMELANDESLQEEIDTLLQGDCSKFEIVEAKIINAKSKVNSACLNPFIKIFTKKQEGTENLCTIIKTSDNEFDIWLNEIRDYCQD